MCSIFPSADIETIFDPERSPLNHIWSYGCDGCCDPIPYVSEIQNLVTIHKVVDISPQKKSIRLRCGFLGLQIYNPIPPNTSLARNLYRLVNRQKHPNVAHYPSSSEYIQNLVLSPYFITSIVSIYLKFLNDRFSIIPPFFLDDPSDMIWNKSMKVNSLEKNTRKG